MKKLTSTSIIIWIFACGISFAIIVHAISGDLIWKKTVNPSSGYDAARGVAVDGTSVYIVGIDYRFGTGDPRWRIEKRSITDGSLIWKKTSNPSDGPDHAYGVAVYGTGVYIVGYDSKPDDPQWRIEKRSTTGGNLIWKKTTNPTGVADVAWSVAVDSTSVYVVGFDYGINMRWRIEKRSSTYGSRDWLKTSKLLDDNEAFGVAVYGTYVYIVGYDSKPGNERWRIEKRSTSDGSLIWKKYSNPSSGDDVAYGVAVYGTYVYIVGYDSKPGNARWRIEKRSTSDGSLIWKKFSNPSLGSDIAYGVAVDDSGVYVVGYDSVLGGTNYRWRIEKRDHDGSLIWKKTRNPSSSLDKARSVAVDSDGVYIVGYDRSLGISNSRWRIEKREL